MKSARFPAASINRASCIGRSVAQSAL